MPLRNREIYQGSMTVAIGCNILQEGVKGIRRLLSGCEYHGRGVKILEEV